MEIVGVSRARTSGSFVTKSGRKAYRGRRRHWYVYFYDDDGRFKKKKISAVEVPYYGSLIRRRKSYQCRSCGNRFRSINSSCPKCGAKSYRLDRKPAQARDASGKGKV
jgi:DNA-directed RNA polymerase subunit RPC12/RpoP